MKSLRIAALGILAAASLAGCGGGEDSTAPAADASRDDDAVLARWAEFGEAFTRGDGEVACSLADEDAQSQIVEEARFYEDVDGCEEAVAAMASRLDSDQAKIDWQADAEDQEVIYEGNRASVYEGDASDFRPMVSEDGEWKVAAAGPEPPPLQE